MLRSDTSIFLIGYRGSGKSTLGRLLARKLACTFLDTDEIVEQTIAKSITRCFAEDGEAAFRAQETAALEKVCRRISGGDRFVIATGGGIVLDPRNVEAMRRAGLVVWLTASVETLRRRLDADSRTAATRPALSGQGTASSEVSVVLEQRKPLYRAACDLEILTDEDLPESIASLILAQAMDHGALRKSAGP